MRNFLLITTLFCSSSYLWAQKQIGPGNSDINNTYLKKEKSLYTIYYVKDSKWDVKGTYTKDQLIEGNNLIVTTNYIDDKDKWYRKTISTANFKTLAPTTFLSESTSKKIDVKFGNPISAKLVDLKDSKNSRSETLNLKENFFDYHIIEPLLSSLPLKTGYKVTIPTFYYSGNPKEEQLGDYVIQEVKSYEYQSPKTGKHPSWLISLLEKSSNSVYYYIVDKQDHRLWQREMFVGDGVWEICANEELDYQPIKNKFDQKDALDKVNNGNSSIIGTAFARDHAKGGISIVNINKAQYAPKGTEITLIVNSPYIKEWKEVNKKIRKEKKVSEVPIDKNVSSTIKIAKVYDDKGHFEFTNLKPGEYILMTTFGFTHKYSYSYQSGTSYLMHPSGAVLGSNPVYSSASGATNSVAEIEKVVTIKQNGEEVKVNLKDTH